jgi:class 3 adenylate cyclase/predicted Ser/Thr protein kinase/AAA+ ATPase superfamily predicted ATPase
MKMRGITISHYEILDKIGEGGMGEVYLALDKQLERKTAIKVLTPNSSFGDDMKKRFKREAQAAAALNHANIVTIYELGEFEERPYIVMEYVPGKSLRDLLHEKKNLSLNDAVDITIQICEGLNKAHQAGIVHRDIKPENIVSDSDGMVKILDFGLAKLKGATQLTKESVRMGTVHYMSPEQISGDEIDPRSDIFSLGAVFYELLTGSFPFKGDYEMSVMYAIVNEDPLPLRDHNAEIPDVLQQIIDKALQKKREDRYANIEEFLDHLIEFKNGHLAPAHRNQTIEELLEHREKIDQLIEHEYKRDVTIMFCDVVGSTRYFEQRGDIEGRAMLQRYTRLMFPIIEQLDGKIIKTIGDGIMASFQEPAQGCLAAIQMQKMLFVDNQNKQHEDRIKIRIALHFGQGVIEQEDVFGDVVNVAARVEEFAGPDQIVLSEHQFTQIAANTDFNCMLVGSASLKGKEDEMRLYRLKWTDDEELTTIEPIGRKSEESSPVKTGSVRLTGEYKLRIPPEETPQTNSESMNPYMNRVMIKHRSEFYGRRNEVSKIFSRIGSSRPQSVSVVGERRIGKSSLLNYIYHPRNRQKFLNKPDEFVFIFIDFQQKRGINIEEFFQTMFDCLILEFDGNLELDVNPDYEGFKKIISTFDQHGLKTIMIFDEFEIVTKNKNFDSDFYSFCRSMANNYNVAYLVASGRNLQSLCHSREISDSPFFNIFSNITLGQFNDDEARDLIVKPSLQSGYSLESHISLILDIAGYYPFFIQMICAVLYEIVKEEKKISKAIIEQIKEEFMDEARVHFQQIWDICDAEQRNVIFTLAANDRIHPSREYLVKHLIKAGYVKMAKKKPAVFSSMFAEYILERYSPSKKRNRKSALWPFG